MEYKIEKVKEKPTKAPQDFCVYEYNNEKYIFCPIRNKQFISEFDEALWGSLVEKIVVKSKDDVMVVFKDGTEIKAEWLSSYGSQDFVLGVFLICRTVIIL